MQKQDIGSVQFVGEGLQRPECVLATKRGELFMSDRAGIAIIGADGVTRRNDEPIRHPVRQERRGSW